MLLLLRKLRYLHIFSLFLSVCVYVCVYVCACSVDIQTKIKRVYVNNYNNFLFLLYYPLIQSTFLSAEVTHMHTHTHTHFSFLFAMPKYDIIYCHATCQTHNLSSTPCDNRKWYIAGKINSSHLYVRCLQDIAAPYPSLPTWLS